MNAVDNQFRARAMTRIAQANQARRMQAKHDDGSCKAYEYLVKRGWSHEAAVYVVLGS